MSENIIPVIEPSIGKQELEYVTDAINSGWVSSRGKYIEEFEKQFDKWRDNLISEVRKISPSQASIFQVLGTYQRVTVSAYQGSVGGEELRKMLGIIVEYTERIKEFVDRFSLENLANRVKKYN